MALSSHQWLKAVNHGQVLRSVYSKSQAAASRLRPLFLFLFIAVPMATAPPSPKCLELGPGLFWLRTKLFSCCVYPELTVTSPSEEPVQRCWKGPGEKERESEAQRRREERRGGRDKIKGYGGTGWGEGEKPRALHHCWSRVKKGRTWVSGLSEPLSVFRPLWMTARPLVF